MIQLRELVVLLVFTGLLQASTCAQEETEASVTKIQGDAPEEEAQDELEGFEDGPPGDLVDEARTQWFSDWLASLEVQPRPVQLQRPLPGPALAEPEEKLQSAELHPCLQHVNWYDWMLRLCGRPCREAAVRERIRVPQSAAVP